MKRTIILVTACLLASSGGAALRAIYVHVEVKRVPVARLAASLEAEIAADPSNVQARINLARLHGMAYALRSDEVPAAEVRGGEAPWYGYGYESGFIPYESKPLGKDGPDSAREHLRQAIVQYEAALGLDPDNLLARLGYGWVLEQAGEKARAIEEYRKVIASAWRKEKDARMRSLRPFFTHEAATYLIPLLDPQRDTAEIDELRSRQRELAKRPRAVTPIAIPLRDGMRLDDITNDAARVRFDADGSGIPRHWTWISPDAGWLVYDAGGAGQITSALQWFGNVSFWLFWENGYQPLAALDDNHDGELSGVELARLAVWRDSNQNGISERGEVRALEAHGIDALSCRYVPGDGRRLAAQAPLGVRFSDGTWRPTYDIILRAARDTTD